MVSVLVFRFSGFGSSFDGGYCVMLQSKIFLQFFFMKVDKWVFMNFMLGKFCDGIVFYFILFRVIEIGVSWMCYLVCM